MTPCLPLVKLNQLGFQKLLLILKLHMGCKVLFYATSFLGPFLRYDLMMADYSTAATTPTTTSLVLRESLTFPRRLVSSWYKSGHVQKS